MKNLQNLKGAKALNKNEQQSINGGAPGPILCGTFCLNQPSGVSCTVHVQCPDEGVCMGDGTWQYK